VCLCFAIGLDKGETPHGGLDLGGLVSELFYILSRVGGGGVSERSLTPHPTQYMSFRAGDWKMWLRIHNTHSRNKQQNLLK